LSLVCDYKEMIYDHGSCMIPDYSAMWLARANHPNELGSHLRWVWLAYRKE
jgi:hypothetical protein